MWKRKLAGTALIFGLLLTGTTSVYAGNINAEEQRIIDYYNGTVTYEGKTYYFAEHGKQKAYNKLMEDDVDLTAVQVDSAIRQANANLKRGIEEGYLIEVTDNGTEQEQPGTETPDPVGPDPGTQEPGATDPGIKEDGTSQEGTEPPFGIVIPEDKEKNDQTAEEKKYPDAAKTDVQKLLEKALEEGEYAGVKASDSQLSGSQTDHWAVTVEQFLKGTVDVVAKDGSVLLSTGLPIKNTGYYTGGIVLAVVLFAGILCIGMVVITIRKKKGYFSMPVLTAAVGIAVFVVFAGGFLESEAGKWNALWIMGSPEYTYAAESEYSEEALPLPGEQYGEIYCDEIGLKAPLYYGDTQEILGRGAGTYAGGNLPGQGGEIIAGGHDATFFAPLESVQEGMILSVKTGYGQYEYEVTGTEIIDVKAYKEREPETEEMTLYTCYPFGAEEELRNERFFVYAKKVSGPEIGE